MSVWMKECWTRRNVRNASANGSHDACNCQHSDGNWSAGKTVFAPLEQLRRAMEQYSTGDLDVRLPERENVSQIGQLYQTFNHMADQIQILRIDVYEKELERQRARSRFLQVQIQPHFIPIF